MRTELIDLLRTDLGRAGYRAAAVRALLGVEADEARQRGIFTPAQRALAQRSAEPADAGGDQTETARATLVRLFLLGEAVSATQLTAALPTLGAAGSAELGLVNSAAGAPETPNTEPRYRAALSLNPVEIEDSRLPEPAEWCLISDLDDQLRRGPARPDHVMGVGGATRSLIAQATPDDSSLSLDLGTGCGVVALHLALRGPVIATDVSERALTLAAANARLNGVDGIDFRHGSLFAPVAGERFELILSNPPFVVTPRSEAEGSLYEYRDGGLVGDALTAQLVREAPEYLRVGGELLCLANWESHWGTNGLERVRSWCDDARRMPLAYWVIERSRVSPARYAETWARDGGARPGDADFERLIDLWLSDFEARRVVALGLGSIRMRRLAESYEAAKTPAFSADPARMEQAEGAFSPAPGAHLTAAFNEAIAVGQLSDEGVLSAYWLVHPAVIEHREHAPGQEAPSSLALASATGIARRVSADPLLAAAIGACDGDLTLAQIAGALADIFEVDLSAVAEALVAGIRELVWLGLVSRLQ